jgi:rod shape-determining protein MreD
MSRERNARRLPILITIVIAMTLTIVPLPAVVEPYRPDWVALTLIYWAMTLPRSYSVGSAWIVGIVLDVAQGTLLGQHALALCFIIYVTVKFHLQLRVFPLSQMTATVFALLALYQFLLFWINGVAGLHAEPVRFWGPVLTGTALWPVVSATLGGVRYRIRAGGR